MSQELRKIDRGGGTLQDRLRSALGAKLGGTGDGEVRFKDGRVPVLLLDITGSMYGKPIEKLREATRDFKGVRRFVYSDTCWELAPGEEIPRPQGPNYEPVAFNFLKSLGVKDVILVTDGYPDRPEESLAAARGLRIDIIYIGPPPVPKFLQDLAMATGGSFDKVNFSAELGTRELTGSIKDRLRIEAPKTAEKGPILL